MREALASEGLDPEGVQLLEVGTEGAAEREGFVGSPTIRIDGVDVAPAAGEAVGLTCRIYHLRDGRVSPVPDPQDIREAIREAIK